MYSTGTKIPDISNPTKPQKRKSRSWSPCSRSCDFTSKMGKGLLSLPWNEVKSWRDTGFSEGEWHLSFRQAQEWFLLLPGLLTDANSPCRKGNVNYFLLVEGDSQEVLELGRALCSTCSLTLQRYDPLSATGKTNNLNKPKRKTWKIPKIGFIALGHVQAPESSRYYVLNSRPSSTPTPSKKIKECTEQENNPNPSLAKTGVEIKNDGGHKPQKWGELPPHRKILKPWTFWRLGLILAC